MRLVPRSLFGRLVLVLMGVLVVAQLLSAAINQAERSRLLVQASGMQSAQRIAQAAKLLDSLGPEERRRVVAILDAPPQAVTLEAAPVAAGGIEEGDPYLAIFRAILRRALDDDREVRVSLREGPDPAALERARRAIGRPGFGPPEGAPGAPSGMGPGPGHGPMRMMMGGRYFIAQVRLADGAWLRFDTHAAEEAALSWRLAAALAVLLAAVLGVSVVAVRWVTRPLRSLADAAEALGRDLNRPPLPEAGPTEVREAARAFNRMQSRIAGFVEERTRVLAAVSHDLKTPITRMRLRTELLDDGEVRLQFERDLAEMEAMVADTLAFMRGVDATEPRRPVDVMALLESVQADQRAMGREVGLAGGAKSPVTGAARLLRRCVSNLVDNAVAYGGRADIVVEEGPADLAIRVRDAGPGVPEAELEKVFEPFYRLEGSRSRETGGTGLGLGIARNVARAHGGDLTLRNRPEGGLEATLTLPRMAGPRPG